MKPTNQSRSAAPFQMRIWQEHSQIDELLEFAPMQGSQIEIEILRMIQTHPPAVVVRAPRLQSKDRASGQLQIDWKMESGKEQQLII